MKKLAILITFVIIVLGCVLTWSFFTSRDTSVMPIPTVSESEVRSATLLAAHKNYEFVLPAGWSRSEPTGGLEYSSFYLKSPDFVPEDGPYGGISKGALISIATYLPPKNESTIEEIIAGKPGTTFEGVPLEEITSNRKRVTVGGLPAVQFNWHFEGPARFLTVVDKDGVRYEIIYDDTITFKQHSAEYYKIIRSFKFK